MGELLLDIPQLDTTTRWLLAAAVGLTIFYAVMRPLKKKKDPLERSSSPSLAGQRAVEREMNNLLVELSEMARQLTAQLDTRAMKLEILLKDADERIAALKAATADGGARENPAAAEAMEPPSRPRPLIDPRHMAIYDLADQSLSTQQIAGRLGRPRGEIELILALRPNTEATAES